MLWGEPRTRVVKIFCFCVLCLPDHGIGATEPYAELPAHNPLSQQHASLTLLSPPAGKGLGQAGPHTASVHHQSSAVGVQQPCGVCLCGNPRQVLTICGHLEHCTTAQTRWTNRRCTEAQASQPGLVPRKLEHCTKTQAVACQRASGNGNQLMIDYPGRPGIDVREAATPAELTGFCF